MSTTSGVLRGEAERRAASGGRRRSSRWGRAAAVLAVLLSGCGMIFGVEVPPQEVPAACGMCVFHQTEIPGCYWAVEIDGAYYPVNGQLPTDHDAHAPGGMCTMPRRAVVSGKLRSGQLFADRFELLPLADGESPAVVAPHQH